MASNVRRMACPEEEAATINSLSAFMAGNLVPWTFGTVLKQQFFPGGKKLGYAELLNSATVTGRKFSIINR